MKPKAFFAIHFGAGFVELWLTYYYAQLTMGEAMASNLWLKAGIETAFLVAGVIWGNLGWDEYKYLKSAGPDTTLAFALANATASLAVGLPIVFVTLDTVHNYSLVGFSWAIRQLPLSLIAAAAAVQLVLLAYRKEAAPRCYRQ
jgi:hypothetical protein